MRQEELIEILAQAGPKAKELAAAIGMRRQVELHIHIAGPIIIGADVAQAVAFALLKATKQDTD